MKTNPLNVQNRKTSEKNEMSMANATANQVQLDTMIECVHVLSL